MPRAQVADSDAGDLRGPVWPSDGFTAENCLTMFCRLRGGKHFHHYNIASGATVLAGMPCWPHAHRALGSGS